MVETSFCELRAKSVINVVDGSLLGHICDIVLEICTGHILGFVVPCSRGFFHIFKSVEEIFIPYHNVCKIGKDVILVELNVTECRNFKACTFSEVSGVTTLDNNTVVPEAYQKSNNATLIN